MMCFLPFITLLIPHHHHNFATSVLMEFCSEAQETTTEAIFEAAASEGAIINNEEASSSHVLASISTEQGELRRSLRPHKLSQPKVKTTETQDTKTIHKNSLKQRQKLSSKGGSGRRVVVKKRNRGKPIINQFCTLWYLERF